MKPDDVVIGALALLALAGLACIAGGVVLLRKARRL